MRRLVEGLTGTGKLGVVWGLQALKPASGLTLTYLGGYIRVTPVAGTTIPQGYNEFAIAGATNPITASRDAYFYVTTAGTLTKLEVANNAAKPSQATIGVGSQFVWKVVTNGTDITSVSDLRQYAGADLVIESLDQSFVAAEVGSSHFKPGFRGRVLALDSTVTTALAGTDTGSETLALGDMGETFSNMTGGSLTHSISAAIGERRLAIPTTNADFGPGDSIRLTSAKTTSGGKAYALVIMERLG